MNMPKLASVASAAVATLAAFCMTPALAAEGLRPVFGFSVTGGGETLASVTYTDGSTQKVKSGGLVHLFGGVEYQGAGYAVQANVGYHVDDTSARNGSVKFARVPVELLGFWQLSDTWRLGGGLRKASNAKITSSGAASNVGSATFEGKAGVVLQGEYRFWGETASVLLRYVAEDYTINRSTISGNHVGLGIAFRF